MDALKQQRNMLRTQLSYRAEEGSDTNAYKCVSCCRGFAGNTHSAIQRMLMTKSFEVLILVLVFLTFITTGLTIPHYSGTVAHDMAGMVVLACNVVFTLEVVLKMIAWGLWKYPEPKRPRKPFFRQPQNVLDLGLCIFIFIRPNSGLAALRLFRFINSADVGTELRSMSRFRLVTLTLATSFPSALLLFGVLIVQCMWLGFPGVWLFGGRAHARCFNRTTTDCCIVTSNVSGQCVPPDLIIPCSTGDQLGNWGNNCSSPDQVCEVRDCFRSTIYNYDNIGNAVIMNLAFATYNAVWGVTLLAEAVGHHAWWFFPAATLLGVYVRCTSEIIVLYRYVELERLPYFRRKRGGDGDDDEDFRSGKFRMALQIFVEGRVFRFVMLCITVIDVVSMVFSWYGIPRGLEDGANIVGLVCSVFFLIEFILKFVAYGLRGYFRDAMNCLDFFLVIIIVLIFVEFILESFDVDVGAFGTVLSAVRTLRVFRFLRVIQNLPLGLRAKAMSSAFLTCMPTYLGLVGIYFMFFWSFAVLGCNIANELDPPRPDATFVFNSLWSGLISTVALSTGEAWPDVLNQVTQRTDSWWVLTQVALYIILVVAIGSYLIPSLFLALQITHFQRKIEEVVDDNVALQTFPATDGRSKVMATLMDGTWHLPDEDDEEEVVLTTRALGLAALGGDVRQPKPALVGRPKYPEFFVGAHRPGLHLPPGRVDSLQPHPGAKICAVAVATHRYFPCLQGLVIIGHCATIALINDRMSSGLRSITDLLQIGFIVVTLLELLLKLHAFGVKQFVTASLLNVLDLAALVCAVIGIWVYAVNCVVMLRLVHIVRFLPFSRNVLQGFRKVFPTLFAAFLLLCVIYFCFCLMGIALFAGKFWNCWACPVLNDGTYDWNTCYIVSNATQFCTQSDCVDSPAPPGLRRFWLTTATNFDNLFWAALSSLRIAYQAQWTPVMFDGLSVQAEQDRCLLTNSSQVHFVYFLAFIIAGGLVGLSWFMGITAYMMATSHLAVPAFEALSQEQRDWYNVVLNNVTRHSPHPRMLSRVIDIPDKKETPINPLKRLYLKLKLKVQTMLNSRGFVLCMFLIELVYFCILCTMHWGQSSLLSDIQRLAGCCALAAYVIDAVLKLWIYGFLGYFTTNTFVFEFITMAISGLMFFLEPATDVFNQYYTGYPFAFARLVRLPQYASIGYAVFSKGKTVGGLWFYEVQSYYVVGSVWFVVLRVIPVGLLWCVFAAAQAVVAVELFQNMRVDGIVISDTLNFQSWWSAFFQVGRMSLGPYWVDLLYYAELPEPFCDPATTCVWSGAAYFIAFPAMIGFLFVCVKTSIVVDFVTVKMLNNKLDFQPLKTYCRLWAHLDPHRSGAIPAHRFEMLWRTILETYPRGQTLHVGLKEWRENPMNEGQRLKWPSLMKKLAFPVILWPVTRDRAVLRDDGLMAMTMCMTGVGYMEMRMLMRLVNVNCPAPEHQFWTVTHARLAAHLETIWENFVGELTERYTARYNWYKSKVEEQPTSWDNELHLFDPDAECGKTPCPTPATTKGGPFNGSTVEYVDWELNPSLSTRSSSRIAPSTRVTQSEQATSSSSVVDDGFELLLQQRSARRLRIQETADHIRLKTQRSQVTKDGDDSSD